VPLPRQASTLSVVRESDTPSIPSITHRVLALSERMLKLLNLQQGILHTQVNEFFNMHLSTLLCTLLSFDRCHTAVEYSLLHSGR
jgi:hypothetical protein